MADRARRGGRAPARSAVVAAAFLASAAVACSHAGRRPEGRPERRAAGRAEVGLASYYARSFHGRRTASGDRYDRHEMTCAHRWHAFGTLLRVTLLEGERSVLVTVTDRGPFAAGRVVDLSWAAAKALGILERGLARVRVESVER
jgi:rare lipoprotein A